MLGWSGTPRVSFVPRPKATPKARPSGASNAGFGRTHGSHGTPLPVRPRLVDARSRSPDRRALPGLREDAPGRRAVVRAQLPNVLSQPDKEAAVRDLEADVLSASTSRSHQARLRTIDRIMVLWGLKAWPPTLVTWKALASTLKLAGYASAPLYLSAYRSESERRGFSLTSTMLRNIADYNRSCLRGLGAPARPKALPLLQLYRLPRRLAPFAPGGPLNSRAAIMCGAWWMCREIELSTARARLLEFETGNEGKIKATLHLPASKTDLKACGVARSLMCSCSSSATSSSSSSPSPECVVHALLEHAVMLRRRFPGRWSEDGPDWDLPLFPDELGEVVTKHSMAEAIREAGRMLGVSVSSPDGSERITGHSLRVSGAQGLAQLGWHLWTVQLHGRWGSEVVKRYFRDSPLASAALTSSTSGPSRELDVEALVAAVVSKLSHPDSAVSARLVRPHVAQRIPQSLPPLAEIAAQVESERSAVSTEPEPRCSHFVLNTGSGTYHRRAPRDGSASCGWSYSGLEHALVPDVGAGPQCWIQLCSRCWPGLREAAKATGVLRVLPDLSA